MPVKYKGYDFHIYINRIVLWKVVWNDNINVLVTHLRQSRYYLFQEENVKTIQ